MLTCRISLALGMLPSDVEQMPARDYDLLRSYWLHEPWGAWRDNLHIAILASEIRRPNLKRGARIALDDFMIHHPDDIAEQQAQKRKTANRNLFEMFKAVATKRPRSNG